LQAEIDVGGEIAVAKTAGPVDPGLFDWTHLVSIICMCWLLHD